MNTDSMVRFLSTGLRTTVASAGIAATAVLAGATDRVSDDGSLRWVQNEIVAYRNLHERDYTDETDFLFDRLVREYFIRFSADRPVHSPEPPGEQKQYDSSRDSLARDVQNWNLFVRLSAIDFILEGGPRLAADLPWPVLVDVFDDVVADAFVDALRIDHPELLGHVAERLPPIFDLGTAGMPYRGWRGAILRQDEFLVRGVGKALPRDGSRSTLGAVRTRKRAEQGAAILATLASATAVEQLVELLGELTLQSEPVTDGLVACARRSPDAERRIVTKLFERLAGTSAAGDAPHPRPYLVALGRVRTEVIGSLGRFVRNDPWVAASGANELTRLLLEHADTSRLLRIAALFSSSSNGPSSPPVADALEPWEAAYVTLQVVAASLVEMGFDDPSRHLAGSIQLRAASFFDKSGRPPEYLQPLAVREYVARVMETVAPLVDDETMAILRCEGR